ncbi:MAG: hypothetical protein ACLQU2_24115 [Candidatus Binataceae bacterium]
MWGNGEKSPGGDIGLPGHGNGETDTDGTSPKQVAANRRNAMRSTGPRTPKGKEVSKFNATKHGLRASEIVIPGQEDALEFEALHQELLDDWMPEGCTEISLVNEIAIAQWRLRRAHRAELGEIRNGIMDATARDPADEIADKNPFTPLPEVLKKSAKGIGHLKFAVEIAMGELESKGTVSRETCDTLDKVFGEEADNPARMLRVWFLDEMSDSLRKAIENNPLPEGFKPDKKAAARQHLELCWNDLEGLRRKVRQREKLAREIGLQRLSIPNGPGLERIQRYETSIKRDMYRAMDQHGLQRRRRGEPPPPTVNVNVSSDDDD